MTSPAEDYTRQEIASVALSLIVFPTDCDRGIRSWQKQTNKVPEAGSAVEGGKKKLGVIVACAFDDGFDSVQTAGMRPATRMLKERCQVADGSILDHVACA